MGRLIPNAMESDMIKSRIDKCPRIALYNLYVSIVNKHNLTPHLTSHLIHDMKTGLISSVSVNVNTSHHITPPLPSLSTYDSLQITRLYVRIPAPFSSRLPLRNPPPPRTPPPRPKNPPDANKHHARCAIRGRTNTIQELRLALMPRPETKAGRKKKLNTCRCNVDVDARAKTRNEGYWESKSARGKMREMLAG